MPDLDSPWGPGPLPLRGGRAVVVTGSRYFAHQGLVRAALEAEARGRWPLVLRVGDCPTGADAFARGWASRHSDRCDVEVFRARWRRADGTRDRTGGPARNAEMVAAEPPADRCLAFYAPSPALNRGTSGCVALARAAGIEVWEFCRTRPWGDVVTGDVIRGADGLEWAVDDAERWPGVVLSHDGRRVTGRPKLDATVEVIARGELGRAIDNLAAAGLQAEVIDTGRKNR